MLTYMEGRQFSLRSLLILTALVAVGLGLGRMYFHLLRTNNDAAMLAWAIASISAAVIIGLAVWVWADFAEEQVQ